MSTLADHDELIEIIVYSNVQNRFASYKKNVWKSIEIYILFREYDVVPTTVEEHAVRSNNFEKMTQVVNEKVIGLVSSTSS